MLFLYVHIIIIKRNILQVFLVNVNITFEIEEIQLVWFLQVGYFHTSGHIEQIHRKPAPIIVNNDIQFVSSMGLLAIGKR